MSGWGSIGQDLGNSIIGNVPKAILCVRDISKIEEEETIQDGVNGVNKLQKNMLKTIGKALKNSANTSKAASLSTFATSASDDQMSVLEDAGYVGMEVQYNPSSIHFESQAGKQVDFSGGTMGSAANNQIVQVVQPVSTTMTLQLIFEDINVYDAFMLTDMMPTVGNAVSAGKDIIGKGKGGKYSVEAQIDGLVALLTMDQTRQVIFFWSKMCFRGEITSVNSSYTMFNTSGNPIRGVVNLTIRQGSEEEFAYDEQYWETAFDALFGGKFSSEESGKASKASKIMQNNILNTKI